MTRARNRNHGGHHKAFDVLETAIRLCAALREPLERIRQHDPDLADQVKRACNVVPLQLSEARRRTGRDRLNRYRTAAGSADELHTALRVAMAWRYLEADALVEPLALLDRVLAMCWRLTH